jgi:hypothetical protein
VFEQGPSPVHVATQFFVHSVILHEPLPEHVIVQSLPAHRSSAGPAASDFTEQPPPAHVNVTPAPLVCVRVQPPPGQSKVQLPNDP